MANTDYRESHLTKGRDYDEALGKGDFNTYMTIQEQRLLPSLVRRLFPETVPRYLDFACGTGRITSLVENLATESFGVDVSTSMIEEAREKCQKTTFHVRDITRESLGVDDISLVTTFRFFGNAQHDLRRDVLAALHKVMADGGYLIFNNHRNPGSLHARLQKLTGKYEDTADLSHQKVRELLKATGFRIVDCVGIGWWLLMHRLNRPRVFASPFTKALEPLSRWSCLAPYCPSYLVVARK